MPPTLPASGVRLGLHTDSFRDLLRTPGIDEVDTIVQAMTACDVRDCELFGPQIEPQYGPRHPTGHHASMSQMSPQMMRRELRKWRLRTPLDRFRLIGRRFRKAGVVVYAYNYRPDGSFTDQEIDHGFGAAKALGAQIIAASTTLDVAKRIVPFAERHQMVVALHGQAPTGNPNQLATPESFAVALRLSKYFKVSLDIGHFAAGDFDAVAYIRQHHADITAVHLKDRRKNLGETVPWGQGDTPIREVLQLLKREGWPISAYVDYEYNGRDNPVEEVKKCLAYAMQALA